jgi:hypothetical protein
MTHLTDMEELVSSIQSTDIRDYMREAMSCYMAGAYRAAVVLTFIALFDDVMSKLEELSKVNSKARTIYEAARKKRSEQEVFETYLIDQLKAHDLLTALDAGFFETLRTLRNKAAHPSGHHASAEEARFVFYEATKRFLSRPILSTMQLADEVLNSLGNSNLFPATGISITRQVVEKELKNVHPDTYPYLISKLIAKTKSDNKDVRKNAKYFLNGLARTNGEKTNDSLRKYAIEKISSNKSDGMVVLGMLGSNGILLKDLDGVTYERLKVIMRDRIESVHTTVAHNVLNHPSCVFIELFKCLPADQVLKIFKNQFLAFLEKFPYSAYFAKNLEKKGPAFDLAIDQLIANAHDDDPDVTNAFVENIDVVEEFYASHLKPESAFHMLAGLLHAARNGAESALDLRNARFGATPALRTKANRYLEENNEAARAITRELFGKQEDLDKVFDYLAPTPA